MFCVTNFLNFNIFLSIFEKYSNEKKKTELAKIAKYLAPILINCNNETDKIYTAFIEDLMNSKLMD